METTTKEMAMTSQQMIEKAERLEREADTLYWSLLAPSMTERTMREEAKELREKAKKA